MNNKKVNKEHFDQNSGLNASKEGRFIEDTEEAKRIDHQEEMANYTVLETF